MATEAQKQAARINGSRSRGPKSRRGKLRSRQNALRHGYASRGIVLPEGFHAEVTRRLAWYDRTLGPDTPMDFKFMELLTIEVLKAEWLAYEEFEMTAHSAERATKMWDDDRRAAAETLAATLADDPVAVRHELRKTVAGCDALIDRLEGLAAILKVGGAWDAAQVRLAHDCLGTIAELRSGPNRLGPGGDAIDRDRAIAAIKREVKGLRRRQRTAVGDLDAREQAAAEAGLGQELTERQKLNRRYQNDALRRMKVLTELFRHGKYHLPPFRPLGGPDGTDPDRVGGPRDWMPWDRPGAQEAINTHRNDTLLGQAPAPASSVVQAATVGKQPGEDRTAYAKRVRSLMAAERACREGADVLPAVIPPKQEPEPAPEPAAPAVTPATAEAPGLEVVTRADAGEEFLKAYRARRRAREKKLKKLRKAG